MSYLAVQCMAGLIPSTGGISSGSELTGEMSRRAGAAKTQLVAVLELYKLSPTPPPFPHLCWVRGNQPFTQPSVPALPGRMWQLLLVLSCLVTSETSLLTNGQNYLSSSRLGRLKVQAESRKPLENTMHIFFGFFSMELQRTPKPG